MNVTIIGASKVGRSFARALEAGGHGVVLHARRGRLPRAAIATPLLVLATRDTELRKLSAELARAGKVSSRTAVVHTGGGVGASELDALRGCAAGIGQAHPLLSIAADRPAPNFERAHMLVAGDRVAVTRARELARALGMVPRPWKVEPALYHAAAGLLANGGAALSALAADLLVHAGAPRREVARALGPLLESVGRNVEALGVPAALTGPVRRGDVAMVERHLEAIRRVSPEALAAYVALGRTQLSLARISPRREPPRPVEPPSRVRSVFGERARAEATMMRGTLSILAAVAVLVGRPAIARADDDWLGGDKFLHFGVSVGLSSGGYAASTLVFDRRWERATSGAVFSLSLGAAKELYDLSGHGDASWKDFTWDVIGTAVGTGVALLVDAALSKGSGSEATPTATGLAIRF